MGKFFPSQPTNAQLQEWADNTSMLGEGPYIAKASERHGHVCEDKHLERFVPLDWRTPDMNLTDSGTIHEDEYIARFGDV